jgi:hypothetical protein
VSNSRLDPTIEKLFAEHYQAVENAKAKVRRAQDQARQVDDATDALRYMFAGRQHGKASAVKNHVQDLEDALAFVNAQEVPSEIVEQLPED